MKDKKIKDSLKNSKTPEIPNAVIDKTVQLVKLEFEQTPIHYKMPFRELLVGQIKYISPYIWFVQAMLLLLILFSISFSTHGIDDRQNIMMILSVSAPIIAIVAIPELAKSFSHNMWEIESASKFNLHKLIALRLVIIGVFNLLIITILVVFTSVFYGINFVHAVLYLLVPFNFTNSICLFLLRTLRGKRVVFGCIITGLMIASALGTFSTLNVWYVLTSTFIWMILLIFSIGILVYELINLLKSMRRGGEMTWNYQ